MIRLEPYPDLAPQAFHCELPAPLGQLASPPWLLELLALDAAAPLQRQEDVRAAVRDLLRHQGYRPTGRGKPASEYLVRAAEERALGPINLAVDACNAVSLHSGLPISVVDAGRLLPPLAIRAGEAEETYVFNASGQAIGLAGLPCLVDTAGPCANAVKDSQRTKTGPECRRTLSIVWGPASHAERLVRATAWYRELLERAGAATSAVPCA